jgi:hypothetical protein
MTPFWRKQENVANMERVRRLQATESDGDALQMPCIPNVMKAYITTTTTTK